VARMATEYRKGKVMYRPKRLVGVALGAALLASLAVGGVALAQEGANTLTLHLTPLSDSGVSGTAIVTNVEDGVRVKLNMNGLPKAGVEHINHFHGGGTCAEVEAGDMAPVTIPLNPVVAKEDGTGSATSTIKDVTLDKLQGKDQKRFILLHAKTKKGQGVPPGISCVDIPQGSSTEGVETLAPTGGPQPLVLLGIPLLLILGGTAGLLALRRRSA
jgi:hypothetical protein